jgi:hypothetical protein
MSLLSIVVAKIESRSSVNGQFVIVYTCKPHINHKYSVVIISIASSKMLVFSVLKCCISADEKDRDSMFTTVTTIGKPGCVSNKTQQLYGVFSHRDGAARMHMLITVKKYLIGDAPPYLLYCFKLIESRSSHKDRNIKDITLPRLSLRCQSVGSIIWAPFNIIALTRFRWKGCNYQLAYLIA